MATPEEEAYQQAVDEVQTCDGKCRVSSSNELVFDEDCPKHGSEVLDQ